MKSRTANILAAATAPQSGAPGRIQYGFHRGRPDPLRRPTCSRKCASFRSSARRMSSSASCAISGLRGGARAFRHRPAGRNDPRSVARRPLPRLRHRTGRGVLRQLKRPAAPECASRTPCSAAPSPPAAAVFDFRAHFCHSAPMETHAFGFRLRANAPEGQKRFPISTNPLR